MNPLEIVVTGNISGATAALKTVQAELGKTAMEAGKTDSTLQKFSNDLGTKVTIAGKTAANSLAYLETKLEVLKSSLATEKGFATLATLNKDIQVTEAEISRMTSVGKTGFNDLGVAIGKTHNPLTKAFSGIRQLAYILPGIGIAGIFNLAFEAITPFVEKLFETKEALSAAKNNLQNLNDVMEDANKKAAEQTTNLEILYKAATDVTLSMKDRLAAVKELQKEFPGYFKNISAENILNGQAKDAYDDLALSILGAAKAKAIKDKLDELEAKKLDNLWTRQKILNATTNEYNKIIADKTKNEKENAEFLKSHPLEAASRQGGVDALIKVVAARRQAALDLADTNDKSLEDQKDFLIKFAGLDNLVKTVVDDDKSKEHKGAKVNQFEIDLVALQKNYEQVQILAEKALGANLQDSKRNGIVVNEFLLAAEIKFLEAKEALLKKYNKSDFENFKSLVKAKQALEDVNLQYKIEQKLPNIPLNIPDIGKQLEEKIDPKIYVQLQDWVVRLGIAIDDMKEKMVMAAKITTSLLAPAFDALFASIIDGSGNAFQAFGNALNQAIKQIGVAVLKAIVLGAVLAAITGKPFSIGTIVTTAIKGFAGGVQNFRGGVALVGEQGPELVTLPRGSNVIPNNKLMGAGGINTQVFIPDVIIRGSDLLLTFNRASKQATRNG